MTSISMRSVRRESRRRKPSNSNSRNRKSKSRYGRENPPRRRAKMVRMENSNLTSQQTGLLSWVRKLHQLFKPMEMLNYQRMVQLQNLGMCQRVLNQFLRKLC
ncbi:hypothetical protein M9H77_05781 [Catharanthus roseus]|uniref:Uncharacterized protein n=1 Tax=Catharanthus roseus TaxID=4058 RepID=A0ACC0CI99_CATRO|nr:hypothetical protein M9H77_05781 [Catharanthus roseus]